MDNYDSIFAQSEDSQSRTLDQFDKKAWAEKKQAERQGVYALIDETAQAMTRDGNLFQTGLDVMARFDRYSVGNVILIAAQKPDATKLADFDTWKQNRTYVRKGEDHIKLLEPGEEFQREDGSMGVNYNVKRVFDISQTSSRSRTSQVNHDMRLLLKAMLHNAPCAVEISDNIPDGVGAVYDPNERKIHVRQGMDGPDIFRCLAQELAHAHLDRGGNYNRNDAAFVAYASGISNPLPINSISSAPDGIITVVPESVEYPVLETVPVTITLSPIFKSGVFIPGRYTAMPPAKRYVSFSVTMEK